VAERLDASVWHAQLRASVSLWQSLFPLPEGAAPVYLPSMSEQGQEMTNAEPSVSASGAPDASPSVSPAAKPRREGFSAARAVWEWAKSLQVAIILFLFLLPGIVYGYVAKTFKNHRDVVQAMAKTMNTMGYYMVMAFCASMFIYAFNASNIGKLIAISGANGLQSLGLPSSVTIVGMILVCGAVNLVMGSSSAKWTLLGPIFVPMLMQLGISPELTQAAYRIGDSTTNILTPLMPYFPLIVTFTQKYHKGTGIGTMISIMLPYSLVFLVSWTLFLLAFWGLGLPLGPGSSYTVGG
jgi:p-aminobenzoyl-glutamate transporter AbgT